MSYNANFHRSDFTFHNVPPNFVAPPPPPPIPPPCFIPQNFEIADQEFLKGFERQIPLEHKQTTPKSPSITQVREQLRNMVLMLNTLTEREKLLAKNITTLSEMEWTSTLAQIEENKNTINNILSQINDSYMNTLRRVLAKRAAKRLRLKKLRIERKREKEDRIKELEERSRKIDENLQKIKNDIDKAKQEEEAKFEADIILRDVLQKKQDAKKCIIKLDALVKLRKARQNTAKGRGVTVSESDAAAFNTNIEKLKLLWIQKLTVYEKEESALRSKLKQDAETQNISSSMSTEITHNLAKWREVLFGSDVLPQFHFSDLESFVAVRCNWDQFTSAEGSPLPVGWVVPRTDT